ncbi:hypothetical protein F5B17DRAFT_438198 [Nemania serpens]|nr:hypothetical protein F5B17DRAFT_438198 [Nemania serpens]
MSAFNITSIEGKKCTAVPRVKDNSSRGGVSATSSLLALPTTSTSTSTSISTTFSTSSIFKSTPVSISTTLADGLPNNDPASLITTSATQETLGATSQNNDNPAPTTRSAISSAVSSRVSGSASGRSGRLESSEAGAGLANGAGNNNVGSSMSTKTTVAVAGGVIGGLALISILLFLICTLLTPLPTGPADRGGEKGPYGVRRDSPGPASIPDKLRGRVNGLLGRSLKPGMDLNHGNSQFGPLDTTMINAASRAEGASTKAMTTKARLVGWIENSPKSRRSNNDVYVSMPNAGQAMKGGTDENRQQQQGASDGTAARRTNPRRSQSLSGLGLDFDMENPFVDSNGMSHESAMVLPLATTRAETSNPFSDANAVPIAAVPAFKNNNTSAQARGAATYIQNTRRSRVYSVSAVSSVSTRPSSGATAGRVPSPYRESSVSVETSDTRRTKFRSDPFDLDKPELFALSPESSARGVAGSSDGGQGGRYNNAPVLPNMPRPTHARGESLTSRSLYPSGVSSMADWGDPGPDVGPAAGRWNMPGPDGALGPQSLDGLGRERGKGM